MMIEYLTLGNGRMTEPYTAVDPMSAFGGRIDRWEQEHGPVRSGTEFADCMMDCYAQSDAALITSSLFAEDAA